MYGNGISKRNFTSENTPKHSKFRLSSFKEHNLTGPANFKAKLYTKSAVFKRNNKMLHSWTGQSWLKILEHSLQITSLFRLVRPRFASVMPDEPYRRNSDIWQINQNYYSQNYRSSGNNSRTFDAMPSKRTETANWKRKSIY